MSEFVTVAQTGEIAPGTVKVVNVAGMPIGVANVDGEFYAFGDVCTHDDGPVAEGELEGHQIECPRHGARFDVRTGAVRLLPAVVPIPVYPLRVEGDAIQVKPEPRGWT
ncbi:MAG TPA: non-heme iron oxygenase ferredoxin subunit [Anaerolineae bacterium]|nr:non-heme iron oxygenase ferredoxin subunit [Anaerolineae bacterium]